MGPDARLGAAAHAREVRVDMTITSMHTIMSMSVSMSVSMISSCSSSSSGGGCGGGGSSSTHTYIMCIYIYIYICKRRGGLAWISATRAPSRKRDGLHCF